jgi:hypothetical protein
MTAVYRGHGARHPADFHGIDRGVFQRDRLPPWVADIFDQVPAAAREPYTGITSDGTCVSGLFELQETGASTESIVDAAAAFIDGLSSEQAARALYPADADEVRLWTNAYPLWPPHGVLLDDLDSAQRDLALAVMAASMSPRGYEQARRAMLFNDHLAELTGDTQRDSLGEWIYFFAVFGEPSTTTPWGWQIWGHHVVVSCFMVGGQIVMTPMFIAAEPTVIDEGPNAGLTILQEERDTAYTLLCALDSAQQRQAILYPTLRAEDLPPELNHPTEGRHRAGCGADNLVYPYAGVRADGFTPPQHDALMALVECYVGRMREPWGSLRRAEVEQHIDETFFCWMGSSDGEGAIYYRVQSPVILIEFDNHSGVFLDNAEPEAFHVHTLMRTPNGNDYGRELIGQHRAQEAGQPPRQD